MSDSGIPPLSSSTSVRVHITEQSHYPPSALPLEIFITVGEEEFQGGMVGKIHATDRDPQDTLTYSLAGEETLGRHFSVGATDGKIIATQGLSRGRYAFNVTVDDGTFATTAGVHVHVWHVGREALQQALWMGFHQLTPEELVSDHWRNLQRFLSNKLDIRRATSTWPAFSLQTPRLGWTCSWSLRGILEPSTSSRSWHPSSLARPRRWSSRWEFR